MEEILKTLQILLPLFMLSIGTLTDIRERTVDVRPIIFTGIFGIAVLFIYGADSVPAFLAALAPGMILLAVALASRGGVGMGDGLCTLVLGFYYPPEEVWMILFSALCFGGIVGALLLFCGKGRRDSFPFVPCLLAGFLCCEITKMFLQH